MTIIDESQGPTGFVMSMNFQHPKTVTIQHKQKFSTTSDCRPCLIDSMTMYNNHKLIRHLPKTSQNSIYLCPAKSTPLSMTMA